MLLSKEIKAIVLLLKDFKLIDFLSVSEILCIRSLCKVLRNEIDNLPFDKRLCPWKNQMKETFSLYENLQDLTIFDLKFQFDELIQELILYCCNWMGSVLKPRKQIDCIFFQFPQDFLQRSTNAIVIIDSVWNQTQKTFEEFLNFSFENFVILFLLLVASDSKIMWRIMKLKNSLVREFILLFTGFSSLRSSTEFQQDPFVMTIYEPMTDVYHPSTKMFQIDCVDESIESDLNKMVSYHQKQVMISLTSIFTISENYSVFPQLNSMLINLGKSFNAPCLIKQTKGIGLSNLHRMVEKIRSIDSKSETSIQFDAI